MAYERVPGNATCSCCSRPWRDGEVTDRRTRTDWAEVVRKLVDGTTGNLNTHHPASLYAAFTGGGTAHRPTAGDTLHAEARELAQYSGDRTGGAGATVPGPPDTQPGRLGVGNGAWQEQRNRAAIRVDWRFTKDARIKLKSLYPSIQ